jgi:hypothetical protein
MTTNVEECFFMVFDNKKNPRLETEKEHTNIFEEFGIDRA